MVYEDFVIQLGADDRGPTVRVVRSPAGETEPESLSLDLSDPEIVSLATAFGRAAEAARRECHLATNDDLPVPPVSEVGARLFRALFPAAVRDLYQQSLGRVAARDQGLRIRIGVGLRSVPLARLHAFPWEYLATAGHFLALTREISIVRHLSLGLPNDRPPVPAPLSILVLAGEALQGSGLDLEKERRELEKAWSEPGRVRIHLLPDCTLEALREELLTRDYHALHFMGHGDFSPEQGEGTIAFRDAAGCRIWVSGTELSDQLRDRTSLRLVFLNACKTAQCSPQAPYAGVATALLNVGIPAVLAMQFPISDAAALALSRTFYRRIARGDSVDSAVAEGRLAIRRLAPDNMEWGTPVLFERLLTGHIVEPRRDESPPSVRSRTKHRIFLAAAALSLALTLLWLGFHFRRDAPRNTRGETPAAPQTVGEYRGCVRDGETNEPIKSVTVSVLARSDIPEQRTDDRGNFVLKIPRLPGNDGELQVHFLRDGYKERTERITVREVVVNSDIFLARRSEPSAQQTPDTHPIAPSRPQEKGQKRNVFADSFVDNRNSWLIWPRYGSASAHAEIKDGVYEISPEPGNGFLATRRISLQETESFTIESRFRKREGPDSYFYGLVWGSRDENNFYNFALTGDGLLAVTRKKNGIFYNYIDPPMFSPYIHQGDASNTLSIKKEGNQIEFFVNGHSVYSTVFDPFFGPNVGFITYNGVQISVEDLVVTQAPAQKGADGKSTLCRFDRGPRIGQTQDYAPMAPLPIGSGCQDGAGSTGWVVAPEPPAQKSSTSKDS